MGEDAKKKIDQKTWRAIQRANRRHNGMVNILRLVKRGVPEIDAGAGGVFALQQKYGV